MNIIKKILIGTFLVHSFPLIGQDAASDSAFSAFDSTIVNKKKYIGFWGNGFFYLKNFRNDTILKRENVYSGWEFKDFNKDGYKDVMLRCSGNTENVFELFLFRSSTNRFKKVKNFDRFPAPERIKSTKYLYSYHKSGCADANWDSDLFYIDNFKIIHLGNISGRQCHNRFGVKDAIYIYKIKNGKEILFKTLPIDIIEKYTDYKWGFIKEYWNKNYKLFINNGSNLGNRFTER